MKATIPKLAHIIPNKITGSKPSDLSGVED
jgi:hypothetical protein